MNWNILLNRKLIESGRTSIGEDELMMLAGDIFRSLDMPYSSIPTPEEIVDSVARTKVDRFKEFTGLIQNHRLEESEGVKAVTHDQARLQLAGKFRRKVSRMTDEELVAYLGLLAFEKKSPK